MFYHIKIQQCKINYCTHLDHFWEKYLSGMLPKKSSYIVLKLILLDAAKNEKDYKENISRETRN